MKMDLRSCWLLACLVVLLVTPASAEEQRTQSAMPLPFAQGGRWMRFSLQSQIGPPVEVAPTAKAAKIDDSFEVQEIARVQERIGSLVQGPLFGPADQAEQRRIWAEMARRSRAAEPAITERVSDETILPSWEPGNELLDPLQVAIDQLRASARNFDLLSADLEDAGKYAEADRLRTAARRLRQDARRFATPTETAQ